MVTRQGAWGRVGGGRDSRAYELGCTTLALFYMLERRGSKGTAQEKERPDADMHLKMESEKCTEE